MAINVEWGNTQKYPGLTSNEENNFQMQNNLIKLLYSFINIKFKLNIKYSIAIVMSAFQEVMLYAFLVWGTCAYTDIKKMQVCHNKLLKIMIKLL